MRNFKVWYWRSTHAFLAALLWTIIPSIVLAGSEPAPEYIASLSAFEVQELSDTTAPTNGKETIESVTPDEWLSGDPGVIGLAGVITAWSGGAKAVSGSRLFVHGGGHADSANNGIYAFEFAGGASPEGWTLLDISATGSVRASVSYTDGRPAAVHTYDGAVYAHHNNHIYRFGGAIWNPSGGFTDSCWKYDVGNDVWTRLPDHPGDINTVGSIYDPVSRKIVVGFGGNRQVAFFRTSTDSWSALKSTNGEFWGGDVSGAYDPVRSRGVLVGNGESRVIAIDWQQETLDVSVLPAFGDTELLSENGPSVAYDPNRDSYWIFGGTGGSAGWSSIYEMNAETFEIREFALQGDPIVRDTSARGSYGRYVLMPDWRAIGIVAAHDAPAYVIKLPDADFVPPSKPKPPTEVEAQRTQ